MSTLRPCLIIDSLHPSIFDMLASIGWKGVDVSTKSLEEIRPLISHYEGLLVRTRMRVDAHLLGEQPTLKFVGRAGAGLDNIDLPFLERHHIKVVHASEGNRDAVGEHAVGSLLSLLRHIPKADQEVRSSSWLREENRGEEIMGKTIGIIGYGNMGQAFAQRLSGFSCQVLAYDKYRNDFSDAFARQVTLEELMEKTDVLSLHIPLTSETKGMISVDFLEQFKNSLILVNTARGELVTLQTLAKALKSGKLRGAALDVLENEKLTLLSEPQREAFTYLSSLQSVQFTPHIAGWTFESHYKINQILVQKLQALGFGNR